MSKLKTHFLIVHKDDPRRVRCACYLRYYFIKSLPTMRIKGTFKENEVDCGNCKRIISKGKA